MLASVALVLSAASAQASAGTQGHDLGDGVVGYAMSGPKGLASYDQTDPAWARQRFCLSRTRKTFKSSGCGGVALASVGATLTDNRLINPVRVIRQWGCRVLRGSSVSWRSPDYMIRAGRDMGLVSRNVQEDLGAVRRTLKRGGLAIVVFGPGRFTGRGHYLVLRAVGPKGFYLMDPYGRGQFGHNNERRAFSGRSLEANGLDNLWTFEAR